MHRLTIIFFLILLISSLNACSINSKAEVVYQTRFDFSQVQFYSFYNANADFNADLIMTRFMRNNIELSIEKAMNVQNFIYSEPEKADVIVSFYIVKKGSHGKESGRSGLFQYNKATRYCKQCLLSSGWQSSEYNTKIPPESLIIDLIDTQTKRSVWRATYPLNIKVEENSRKVTKKINAAVHVMLNKYPTLIENY